MFKRLRVAGWGVFSYWYAHFYLHKIKSPKAEYRRFPGG